MKKVTVVNNITGMQFGAQLENPTDWIAQQIASNSWGLPERLKVVVECTPEELASALEIIPETEENEIIFPAQAKLPCEYTITITDLDEDVEYLLEQRLAKSSQNIEFGKSILALVGALVDMKNLSCEQVSTLNSTLAGIVMLLQTGSIETAKNAIAAITPTEIITQNDIDLVVGKMNAYLGV